MQSLNRFFLALIIISISNLLNSQATSSGWVATIIGSGFNIVAETKSDIDGNVYAIGHYTESADFDGSSADNTETSRGETDIFITKHSPLGDLLWVTTFGGNQTDTGFSLDINADGEVYVVGTFEGQANFGSTPGSVTLSAAGRQDMVITKLSQDGSVLWAKRIGGSSVDEANDITIDKNNDLYIVGRFVSTVDFDPGSDVSNLQAGSAPDAFVLKLNENGEYLWAHDFGSGSNEEAEAVEVDRENNVIITGNFSGTTDFDPGANEVKLSGNGTADPFYLKLTPEGSFIWAKSFTSTGFVYSADIDIDNDNNIVGHGFFSSDINFDPSNSNNVIPSNGAEDSYTVKLNSNGQLMWSNIIGGNSIEFAYGVAVDAIGDVYVTGFYNESPDFDPGTAEFFLPSSGLSDNYIVKYDSDGNLIWVKRTEGPTGNAAYGIDISPTGDVLIAGTFSGTSNLDPEPGETLNISSTDGADIFILKINQSVTSSAFQIELSTDVKISPNPTSNFIGISGNFEYPIDITLLNANGKQVSNKLVSRKENHQLQLDNLANGLYYIAIKSGNQSIIKKLIKI